MLVITIRIPAFAGMTVKRGNGGCNSVDQSGGYNNQKQTPQRSLSNTESSSAHGSGCPCSETKSIRRITRLMDWSRNPFF